MFEVPKKGNTYDSIARLLKDRIESGYYSPGDSLPSERELALFFDVSRTTIRNALATLELEGLIRRKRGRSGGTFVSAVPPVVELTNIEGFLPQLRARGFDVHSEVLNADLTFADERMANRLEVPRGATLFNVYRVRSVNGVPLIIENSFFPAYLVPELLHQDLSGSLYELLGESNNRPVSKRERISTGTVNRDEMQLLKVPTNFKVLRISRTAFTDDQVAVEYSEDVFRCDVAQIEVTSTH